MAGKGYPAIPDQDGDSLVRTINSLDFARSGETTETLLMTLALLKEGQNRVVLDLSQADGIDLAGIQILCAFSRSLAAQPGAAGRMDWKLGPMDARIRKLCGFCGIDPAEVIPDLKAGEP